MFVAINNNSYAGCTRDLRESQKILLYLSEATQQPRCPSVLFNINQAYHGYMPDGCNTGHFGCSARLRRLWTVDRKETRSAQNGLLLTVFVFLTHYPRHKCTP